MPPKKKLSCRCSVVLWVFILMTVAVVLTFPVWIKWFYPTPYEDLVIKYAYLYKVDPYLVFAIMRVESQFNPEAVSGRGAVGLMQLMPETARWAACQLGIKDYAVQRLFEPEINIQLGCWYLSDLCREFQGRLPLVMAAYNAGRGNVRDWLLKEVWDGSLEELDRIPFLETKRHVKKVVNDYEAYRTIYSNKK